MADVEQEPSITRDDLDDMAYGPGKFEIDRHAFHQVRTDSDRAAGVVAGSIVELRLTDAIRSQMKSDHPALTKRLFEPDGALGAFGVKIDLAYMLGLLSDSAAADLRHIKEIRNRFAHRLRVDSFRDQSVSDRCSRITIVDRHTGPIVPTKDGDGFVAPGSPHTPYFAFRDHASLIPQPRFRYVTAAQVLCNLLGQGSINPLRERPFV